LSLREDIARKYCSVQNSYEKLFLDYNEAREKITELQNNKKLGENACRVETSYQSIQTDDIDGLDGNAKAVVCREDDAMSETSVLDDITQKVKTILRNHTISVEAEESIFEGIARQYVEAKWKLDVLEKKVTELTRNVKKVEEIKDILQLECEELQSHVHSLLLENQALKSNLPCIPEGSEERVASLETDVESLRDEIKCLSIENKAMREMNSTLLRVAQGEKGPWTNHDCSQENEVCSSVEEESSVSSGNATNEFATSTERFKFDYENVKEEADPSNTKSRDDHAALRNTVDRLAEENKYLLERNKHLDTQLRDKASQERILQEKNDRLLDDLRKRLDAADHESSELQKDILYKTAELEEMRTQIEIKESQIAKMNQDHERLIKETKSLSEQLIATHDESLDKIELLNTEMALLQQEYEDLKQKASICKTELTQVRERLHDAQEGNAKLENECHLLKRKVRELQEAERVQDQTLGMTREELRNEASSSKNLQESLMDERDFLQKRCEVLEQEIQIFRAKEIQFKQLSLREPTTEVIAGDKANEEIKEFANTEDNLTRKKEPVERATMERQDLMKESINITFNESGRTFLTIIDEERREKDIVKAHNEKLLREIIELQNKFQIASENSKESVEMAKQTIESLSHLVREKDEEISALQAKIVRMKDTAAQASNELAAIKSQKSELEQLNAIKHNEGLQYQNEIQRLIQHVNEQALCLQELNLQRVTDEMREEQHSKNLQENGGSSGTDESIGQSRQNAELAVLSEKCGALEAALIQEQSNSRFLQSQLAEGQKKEANSAKELERLRTHLVEMESSYTEEALIAETSRQELEAKLLLAEEKVKSSSTAFTSANIRANQQVETLQQQIALIAQQRDNIQTKLSTAEDKILLQSASLTNLQVVLEQFQQGE